FYTATVYEKGAELVRMIKTILGDDGFAKGLDLYFDRHDGDAATIEDFLSCFEDSAGHDLSQFKFWYEQAGTPQITVRTKYDANAGLFELDIVQMTLPTPGQEKKRPLHIPIRFGLLGQDGGDLTYGAVTGADITGDVIHLKDAHQTVQFSGVLEKPVPSLLRGFSAPVRLSLTLDEDELIHLIGNDNDSYNRWQAMQTIAMRVLLNKIDCLRADTPPDDTYDCFFHGVEQTIADDSLDPAFRAQFLAFPSEADVAQEIGTDVDPSIIHKACLWLQQEVSSRANDTLITLFEKNQVREPYDPDGEQVGMRALKNAALRLLATGGDDGRRFAETQYQVSDNLTDRMAALTALVHCECEAATSALHDFDKRYRSSPLVMDKWFAVQATSPHETTLATVKELMKHPVFSITNPNRIRALIGSFAAGNPSQFHRPDGAGYQFLSSVVVDLDQTNPQVAARLLTSFSAWPMLEQRRKERAERALRRVSNTAGLSTDVRDIVNRTLGT
ncbi:MAG: DUF3458 domain-containing protein, partial [Pseudomonadota bacterium]